MLINLEKMFSPHILIFGTIYVLFAVLSKLLGCGIPALFLNFNWRGALRVGVGMIPRGEVALIVAGIGLSSGLINDEIFNIALIMTFITTLITPPVLDRLLNSPKPVLRKEPPMKKEHRTIRFAMPNPETADLLLAKVIEVFDAEGFFIHSMGVGSKLYHMRKNQSFITLTYTPQELVFDCLVQDAAFIHTLFYEVIANVEQYMKHLQSLSEKEKIGRKIFEMENGTSEEHPKGDKFLSPLAVKTKLTGKTKKEVLEELVHLLIQSGQVKYSKKDEVLRDLWEREATMSTGMQDGIALPHTKTSCVDRLIVAVGVSQTGVDFTSLDKKPSKIFIMTLIPQLNPQPYLRTMSEISRFLIAEKNRQDILNCRTNAELYDLLSQHI
jgi:mannitol/fructose-specific phosphotransferase system IIA component (Ntr-type)